MARGAVRCLYLPGLVAAALVAGGGTPAQIVSLDGLSPSLPGGAGGATLLTTDAAGPRVHLTAADIGLLPGDEVDAVSFGLDATSSSLIRFSVDWFADGAVLETNAVCRQAGADASCGTFPPCDPEVASDIFAALSGSISRVFYEADGDPPASFGELGLVECNGFGPGLQDNIDALDMDAASTGAESPAWRTYLSLAPGSPSLTPGVNPRLIGGASPADILVHDPGHDSLSIYLSGTEIGLLSGDDIDALTLDTIDADYLFSLAPGSPTLAPGTICPAGCTPGDLIAAAGLLCGASPCVDLGIPAEFLGLAPDDNLDAVEQPSFSPGFAFRVPAGKTYSVSADSPVLRALRVPAGGGTRSGSGADLLGQDAGNPAGAPRVVLAAEELGLLPADEIDGVSFGGEEVHTGSPYAVEYSVDRSAAGQPGTEIARESGAIRGTEASADLFFALQSTTPSAVPAVGQQTWDGNGTTAATLQLRDRAPFLVNDDLDAVEGPSSVLDTDGDGVRDRPVLFTLAAGSPSLSAVGATAADILACPAPACSVPTILLSGATLGLQAGDELQDFCHDTSTGTDFTLSAGSPTLAQIGADPGTILHAPGTGGCAGPAPCAVMQAAELGLEPADDLNALDCLPADEICVVIEETGGDPRIELRHGACQDASTAAGPYDVVTGYVRDLAEGGLTTFDAGRVTCRADEHGLDRLTLTDGTDAANQPTFVLVRRGGAQQSDYGPGHPPGGVLGAKLRLTSAGDCPTALPPTP